MNELIPFNRASFDGKELTYLAQAVINGHVSGGGPFSDRAETMLSEMHGGSRTLLTTSCTHALEMAALLIGFEPGDEVIVPAFTFTSTAAAFMLHGATPVFVDVDPVTLNIDLDQAEEAITSRTKAICIVHYAGVAASAQGFADLADKYGLVLVEDNAHGLGGKENGQTLGTFGTFSTLSFHETKNITCGEGGALIINDPSYAERAEILRDKGTNRSQFFRGQVDKYTWVDVGSSWVLSDLLAGVLVGQLERFDDIQKRRHAIWDSYDAELSDWSDGHAVRLPQCPERLEHTAHLFHLRFANLGQRTEFIDHLKQAGVLAVFHYQPLHLSGVGQQLGGHTGQFPIAEEAADTLVRLPLFIDMNTSDVDRVINAVRAFGF